MRKPFSLELPEKDWANVHQPASIYHLSSYLNRVTHILRYIHVYFK